MSDIHSGWVMTHSPYSALTKFIHHRIGAATAVVGKQHQVAIGFQDLADEVGCSPQTVISAVNRMIGDGLLTKLTTGGGRGRKNVYQFSMPSVEETIQSTEPETIQPLDSSAPETIQSTENPPSGTTPSDLESKPSAPSAPPQYDKSLYQPMVGALAAAEGVDLSQPGMGGRAGDLGRMAKEFLGDGILPEHIAPAAERYRSQHPEWDFTARALRKWWTPDEEITAPGEFPATPANVFAVQSWRSWLHDRCWLDKSNDLCYDPPSESGVAPLLNENGDIVDLKGRPL